MTRQSRYVAGRERFPGEVIPAGAELSAIENGKTADRAIDLDLSTNSVSTSSTDGTTWIKVKLEKAHCIRGVIEYNPDRTAQYTWTWSGTKFSCVGHRCDLYHDLIVEVGGKNINFPDMPDCKFGNSVKLEMMANDYFKAISVYEIAVFAAGL